MNNNFFQILFCMVFFFHQFLYIALCLLIFFPYSFQLSLILLTLLCGICLHFAPYLRPRLLRLTLLFQQLHLMAVSILFCLILQPANLLLYRSNFRIFFLQLLRILCQLFQFPRFSSTALLKISFSLSLSEIMDWFRSSFSLISERSP